MKKLQLIKSKWQNLDFYSTHDIVGNQCYTALQVMVAQSSVGSWRCVHKHFTFYDNVKANEFSNCGKYAWNLATLVESSNPVKHVPWAEPGGHDDCGTMGSVGLRVQLVRRQTVGPTCVAISGTLGQTVKLTSYNLTYKDKHDYNIHYYFDLINL